MYDRCGKGTASSGSNKDGSESAAVFPLKPRLTAAYQYHLALAYNQAGQSTQAKQAAQKALQLKQDFDGAADARRILTQNP
jgi:hypothetical protein